MFFPDTHSIQGPRHSYIVISYASSKYISSPSLTAPLQRCLTCSFQIHIQIKVYCILTTLLSTFRIRVQLYASSIRSFQIHIKYKLYCIPTTLFNMFFPNTHSNQGSLHSYNVTQYVLSKYAFNSRFTGSLQYYLIRSFQIRISFKLYCIPYVLSKHSLNPMSTASLQRYLMRSCQIHIQFKVYCILTTLIHMCFPGMHSIQGLLHPYNIMWYVLSKYAFKSRCTAFLQWYLLRSIQIRTR